MIRLLLADDQNMFLEGLHSLLKGVDNFQIVGAVSDGSEVIDSIKKEEVDLILMDINMPQMSGIDALEILKEKAPDVKIIMLSMHNDRGTIENAIRLGADGYLLKNSSRTELENAINIVYSGGSYFMDEVKDIMINSFRSEKIASEIRLTPREREVLSLICKELTTSEIAEKLFVSVNTIETHRKNLLSKTGSKNSIGLVKFAIENQI